MRWSAQDVCRRGDVPDVRSMTSAPGPPGPPGRDPSGPPAIRSPRSTRLKTGPENLNHLAIPSRPGVPASTSPHARSAPERARMDSSMPLSRRETYRQQAANSRQGGLSARAAYAYRLGTTGAAKSHSGVSARSSQASEDAGAPTILPGRAPSDREQKRLPRSTLSRSVSACLTCRALALTSLSQPGPRACGLGTADCGAGPIR